MTDHNFTFWEPYNRSIGAYDQVYTSGYRACEHKNTLSDWGLMLLQRPVISSPSPRLLTREVAGMDGVLDITEDLDFQIYYEERTIKLQFLSSADRDDMDEERADIMSFVHGKYLLLVDEDLPDWYWIGRWTVSYEEDDSGAFALVTITGKVHPYRLSWTTYYADEGYIELEPLEGWTTVTTTITLDHSDWMMSPTIQLTGASAATAFAGGSATGHALTSGVQQIPGLVLGGENTTIMVAVNVADITSDAARIALYYRRGIF